VEAEAGWEAVRCVDLTDAERVEAGSAQTGWAAPALDYSMRGRGRRGKGGSGDERQRGTHPSPMCGLVRRVWLGRREETERRDWKEGARVRGTRLPLIRIEND
jgi:hypothetical protein